MAHGMNIDSVYQAFPTETACISHLERVRWAGKPTCPYCKSSKATPVAKEQRYHCNGCNTGFSVTVRTIFHHTHLPLQKWFLALSLVLNAKKGISARQLGRDLEVNKNTAWRMALQIRAAMAEPEQRPLLTGVVEMDETFVGGKPRKWSGNDDDKPKRGRGTKKTPVVGMLERGGNVAAKVVKKAKLNMKSLSSLVREHSDPKLAILMTDEYTGYNKSSSLMEHKSINHSVRYVDGEIHTNGIESFWALLKRGIVGQYHKVSIRYLQRYINEFCYRFNNRKNTGAFEMTLARAVGFNP